MNVLALATTALVLLGCQASVQADAKVNANDDTVAASNLGGASSGAWAPGANTASRLDEGSSSGPPALLGSRRDLRLVGGKTGCSCLRTAVGAPSEPAFAWDGVRPSLDAGHQIVVALSSDDVPCPGAKKGASYWGYELHGNDIWVIVESAELGRPVATGAVVPRPASGGRILLHRKDRSLPYGQAAGGDCVLLTVP